MSVSFIYPQYLWLLLLIPLTATLALIGRKNLTRLRLGSSLALRSILLILITAALAGIQLRLRADMLTAVFVMDVSDSISEAEQARGEAFIRQAVQEMPPGDKAAVVVFGEDALVERLASNDRLLPTLTSVPISTRTDIASALQLALALFPNEGARRLVLLSDGRENLDNALEQAELAATQDIELRYVPLGENDSQIEVLVESLTAPPDVRKGQDFQLAVVIRSTASVEATLRAFGDGALIQTREVHLQEGINHFQIPVEARETGFRRFRVQVIPDADNRLQNNEASAFSVVHGPPSILVVEGAEGESENLVQALKAAEMDVTRIPPAQIPATLPELASYDTVILVDVPASGLPSGAMEALPVYVRELGRGLLMIGGQQAFGAGGYLRTPLETALPVYMDVRDKKLQANLALVLAVDKSGSMGRCHCDNPDLNQTYQRVEVGQPKVDIAKEAIMRSASALGPQDYLGVVAFDSQARWALPVEPLVDPATLEQAIGTFGAEGQTNLRSGVEAAYKALEATDAKRKHIILMTDGWVNTGDLRDLARKMKDEGITLSVVAAGAGSAEYLKGLSDEGGGRYYPAVDILSVPDIFLKETVTSVGQYIVEEPFYPLPGMPSPVLTGLDAATLPPLLGYNGTSPKNTARLDLLTPRGDPLLASWQYGLGRSAVWTSDFKGQWGTAWIGWEGFPRFAAQLVGWVLPAPKVEGLSAQAALEDKGALIRLEAQDKDGHPLNYLKAAATIIAPDLSSHQVDLEQTGAGQYQALVDLSQPGTYLVRLGANQGDQSLGMTTLGLVVPYSPEYKTTDTNLGILRELAQVTGGGLLGEPLAAFLHDLPSADSAREIWRTLLLVAALLFPVDVAIRRVVFTSSDWRKATAWVGAKLPWRRQSGVERTRALGRLFQARQRARSRRVMDERPVPADQEKRGSIPHKAKTQPESKPPIQAPSPEDALERLKEAKKRARRSDE
jgi:Mg-chelatase subunit ChlD